MINKTTLIWVGVGAAVGYFLASSLITKQPWMTVYQKTSNSSAA